MRLRHSQELGSGRADEVVAAAADELGMATIAPPGSGEAEAAAEAAPGLPAEPSRGQPILEIVRPVRERLWLSEELAL
jgi:hypothetical protein